MSDQSIEVLNQALKNIEITEDMSEDDILALVFKEATKPKYYIQTHIGGF